MIQRTLGAAGLAAASLVGALALASASAPAAAHPHGGNSAAERHAARAHAAGERLGVVLDRAIRRGGPFFTAEERAVIERACGFAPGSWDGYDADIREEGFVCSNGRWADTEEARAVMAVAGPRVSARLSAAINRPEVRAAMDEVTQSAAAAAAAAVDQAEIARLAQQAAQESAREALVDAERTVARVHRELQAANCEGRRTRWR